jgi:hypothetical protein
MHRGPSPASGAVAMTRCPSCAGTGQAFQDEPPCHIPCEACDGTGWDCTEVAAEIQDAFWVTLGGPMSRKYAAERRQTIQRIVAHHMRGARR